jgi:SAM-dependent methyltransferase
LKIKNESQTNKSFRDKWENCERDFFDAVMDPLADAQKWILRRNGFDSPEAFGRFLATKGRILDAGCGNGRVTNLMSALSPNSNIVAIDKVSATIAQKNLKERNRVTVIAADLMESLLLGKFDFIYCQEVLHHTRKPQTSFNNLVDSLAPNGEIAIYVYKKKAPIREFSDEYIRSQVSGLRYEEAMQHISEISELGRTLASYNINVKVPTVRLLEISAGEYDLQRLIYHFFMKCFWNDNYSKHENDIVNYDWYHPSTASKHTLEEVLTWFSSRNLAVNHQYQDEYGITVRGQLKSA